VYTAANVALAISAPFLFLPAGNEESIALYDLDQPFAAVLKQRVPCARHKGHPAIGVRGGAYDSH
jgi:hypothetical protein